MCGIFGVVSKSKVGFPNANTFRNLVDNLAIFSQVRGRDSVGFFYTDLKNPLARAGWFKYPDNASKATEHKDWAAYVAKTYASGACLIGHVRAATVGEISIANTHPHIEGDVTLVHNGTLRTGWSKYSEHTSWSDSRALTSAINTLGTKAFEEISGAYACVWHDAKDGKLHIVRNAERPLSIWEDTDYIVICSEPILAWAAIARAGIDWNKGKLREVDTLKELLFNLNTFEWEDTKEVPVFLWAAAPTCTHTTHSIPTNARTTARTGTNSEFYRTGEEILFELFDEAKMKNGHYMYTGQVLLGHPEAEVVFFKKEADKLNMDNVFYRGSIKYYEGNKQLYRIDSSSVTVCNELNEDVDPTQVAVTTLNGVQLTQEEFVKYAKKKCLNCDSRIDLDEAPLSVYNHQHQQLYCPDCSDIFFNTVDSRVH
jgi:hypothetical protein